MTAGDSDHRNPPSGAKIPVTRAGVGARRAIIELAPGKLPARGYIALCLGVAIVSFPLLWHLSDDPARSDIFAHARTLLASQKSGNLPAYSVLYPLIMVVTGGSATTYADLQLPMVLILSLFMGLKAAAAWWAVSRGGAKRWATGLATLFVLIAAPLTLTFQEPFYLGKISPSVWHNSTTVMAMPFSVVMFVLGVSYLRRAPKRWYGAVGTVLAFVLGIMMKPNFGMVLLPVLGIYSLALVFTHKDWRPVARYMTVAVASVFVLVFQYLGSYASGAVPFRNVIDPFVVWRYFSSDRIPLFVLESLLLAVVATVVVWRKASDRSGIVLAWSCLILAMGVFSVFDELSPSGTRYFHGNWSWAMAPALFVLYIQLAVEWLRQRTRLAVVAKVIVYILVAAYAAFGVNYLVQLAFVGYR